MQAFKAGDSVRLKSGSPELIVLEVNKHYVTAYWIDGMEVKKSLFNAACIDRCEPRKPS